MSVPPNETRRLNWHVSSHAPAHYLFGRCTGDETGSNGIKNLAEAHSLADRLRNELKEFPDLFYAGYTQDSLKEFVEANVTCALIQSQPLQTPEELVVEDATYLNGLAEVIGELRRRTLDILRSGYSEEAERLLGHMDEIYSVLVTIDYPDAITNGLRRQTDLVRGIIEKTRGDVTFQFARAGFNGSDQEVEY